MQTNDYYRALELFFRDSIRRLATVKPCFVQEVVGNRVRVKPLTKTLYKDGKQEELPELFDVPLFIYSAQRGRARVTVPVGRGDLVIVVFSDRDMGNMLNELVSSPVAYDSDELWCLGLYPLCAFPSFFTIPSEIDLDEDDIVIGNGTSTINIAPDGDISIVNTGSNLNINTNTANITATTGLNVTTPLASFSGVVAAAGFQIGTAETPIVEITETSFNINGVDIVVTGADVIANGVSTSTHTHGYLNVATPATTNTPNPTP